MCEGQSISTRRLSSVLKFLPLFFFGLLFSNAVSAQVVINEFSATNLCSVHNPNQVQDNFGNCEDWVELFNPTGAAIDLSGHHLTDKMTNLDKWTFPDGSVIAPNNFLRVWLSGRTGVAFNIENLHASFRIGQTKGTEIIAFVAPDANTILDIYEITETSQLGHSRGRYPDGVDNWVVFTAPSMGVSNNDSTPFEDYAPRPEFSIEAGYHSNPISVEIAIPSPSPDFTIRYTIDGAFPTDTSPIYTGPINLESTTVLMAATFSADDAYLRSFYEFGTYFFGEDQHTLKVFSVSGTQTPTLLFGDQIVPISTMEMFDENGQRLSANLGDINKHGNDSWGYEQRGFDWIDRDKMGYSAATEVQMFRTKDRDSFKRYIFKAAGNDNYPFKPSGAHIRDAYVMSLTQIGGLELDARSVEFCALYVNGQYWGVYDYREKVDDWHFTEYYYDQGQYDIDFLKTWGGTWAEYGQIDDWNTLVNFITSNDMTDQANYEYVKTELNVLSLIDYFCTNTWIASQYWLNWDTAWWKGNNESGEAKKWRYTLWDMDGSLGSYTNWGIPPILTAFTEPCYGENLSNPGGQGHTLIMSALQENEDFFDTYINRYADHVNSTFRCENAIAHLDSMLAIVEPEMPRQIERWGGTMNEWQNNVEAIYDFVETRCSDVIVNGMEDCYDISAIEITIDIVGEGNVLLNSITITPDMTPWTGIYYEEVPFDLTAEAFGNGVFQFWETTAGELAYDDETAIEITVNPDGNVTIVADFEPQDQHPVTFDVFPQSAGFIDLEGGLISPYPFTTSMASNQPYVLQAEPENEFYEFIGWQSVAGSGFTPNPGASNVTLQVWGIDTITASFVELPNHEITVRVQPEGAGRVMKDWSILSYLPWTGPVLGMDSTGFIALPNNEWQFSHWTTINHTPTPSAELEEMQLYINEPDEVVAHFVPREFYFYMPNSFSPNGDGINDIFRPVGNEWIPEQFHMQIINRRGKLVFETRNADEGWNGEDAGKTHYAEAEVYVYRVEVVNAINGESKIFSGHVTVLR